MNDWLDQRLHDGAARSVGDVTLDDPRVGTGSDHGGVAGSVEDDLDVTLGVISPLDDRRHRSAPVLAVAAVLVALVVLGAWLLGRDDTTTVDGTDPAGLDPTPETTDDQAATDATELVADAVEATMTTSWVAEVSVGNEDPTEPSVPVSVTYNPADPSRGRPFSTVLVEGNGIDRAQMALGSSPRLLEACEQSNTPPCRPGAWVEVGVWNAEDFAMPENDYRQMMEASMTLIPNIDPASATATGTDGQYEVTLSAITPCDTNCTATVEMRDGFVVGLTLPGTPGDARSYSYAMFGDAPEVAEPAVEDIIEGPLRSKVLCEVTLHVRSGADTTSIETEARSLEAEMGNGDGAALLRAIRGIPGVLDVSTTTSDGCESDTVSIGFVTDG